jgi:ferredoxin
VFLQKKEAFAKTRKNRVRKMRAPLSAKKTIAIKISVRILGNSPVFKTTFHMADLANKYPENITGKFYVDDQCIDCDLCRETAPANFTRNDDGGHSYVFKQPESPDEENLCKEAMEGCPVEAIGSDGV